MNARPSHPLDSPRFALADRVARRLAGRTHADSATIDAVAVLTAAADPARAERLRPRPYEPAPLIERLAMWALHRAPDAAVAEAERLLDTDATGSDDDRARRLALAS